MKPIRRNIIILTSCISTMLLGFVLSVRAANTDIVINEIGAWDASDHEWIEIYNKGSAAVNITDWRFFEANTNHGLTLYQGTDMVIETGEYAIIAGVAENFAADYPAFGGTIIDSSWGALNNDGEVIALRSSTDPADTVESFTYITTSGFSLERADPTLNDYTAGNWQEHASGNTAGSQNSNYSSSDSDADGGDDGDSGDVVINEVAWMGTTVSANDEWIELKNTTGGALNLDGWTIAAQDGQPDITLVGTIAADGYFLLERTDDGSVSGVTADVIYTGSLSNSGELLQLRDADGVLVDSIDFSGGWSGGDNATKQTFERSASGSWQTSASVGGTPGTVNSGGSDSEGEPEEDEEEAEEGQTAAEDPEAAPPTTSHFGDVVINEFVSDPADGEVEFVELYNKRTTDIDLTGWTLSEGSAAQTILVGTIAGGGAKKFFVVEKPKGNLNNSGDIIILKKGATIIDQVAYGSWDDGNPANNAPAASDPFSVARKGDGFITFNDINDFVITQTVTKGASNIITGVLDTEEETELALLSADYDYSDDIVISEIFPNPTGSDREGEFVELFNRGDRAVDLSGWAVSDNTSKKVKVESKKFNNTIINAQDYFTVYRQDSGIALNNTIDSAKLYQPLKDEPLQSVAYSEVKENWSYSLTNATSSVLAYVWSETITPGEANVIAIVNHAPLADFSYSGETVVGQIVFFDSSDTIDEDGDELSFNWDFGGLASSTDANPLFIFLAPGVQQVTLTVSDGEHAVTIEKLIHISSVETHCPVETHCNASLRDETGTNDVNLEFSGIIISEFLPNPAGADTEGEWIELYNPSDIPINLNGWQLDDEEGGSRPFIIAEDVVIETLGFVAFERVDTKLALNNTTDSVRLFNASGELVDETTYSGPGEDTSYARNGDGWTWTTALTPGEPNVYTAIATASSGDSTTAARSGTVFETTLTDIRTFEPGYSVQVTGTVAVLPGTFGVQYFYITGSPGLQIYNSKKDFPALRIGDRITVAGELSSSYGELRLKTTSADDIAIVATSTPPEPAITETDKIGESMEGWLVRLKGEIVEKKGSTLWLDDGNGEVEVYIKQGTKINKSNLNEGETVTVIGIVTQNNDRYRVFPRGEDDIIKEGGGEARGEVLGIVSENTEWALAQSNRRLKFAQYLLVIAGALIIVLIVLLWRGKRSKI